MDYLLQRNLSDIWPKARKVLTKLRSPTRGEITRNQLSPVASNLSSIISNGNYRRDAAVSPRLGENGSAIYTTPSRISSPGFDLQDEIFDGSNRISCFKYEEPWVEVKSREELIKFSENEKKPSTDQVYDYGYEELSTPIVTSRDEISEKSCFTSAKEDSKCEEIKDAPLQHLSLPKDQVEKHLEFPEVWRFFHNRLSYNDYEFHKETLIQLWLALGFIKGEHKHENGNLFFDTLLSIDVLIRTGVCFSSKKDKYRANAVANFKNDDGACTTSDKLEENVPGNNEDEHVCLIGDDIDDPSLNALRRGHKNLKALLLLRKNAYILDNIPHDLFLALRFLELLDLSGAQITELPSSIGNLTELRYLDLSYTLIELLPESVQYLSKLQTLKLNNCEHLLKLPESTRKLTSLEYLELDVLIQLAIMPRGMGALTKLKTLSAFLIHNDDGHRINELKNMNSLQGSFRLLKLENVSSPVEAKEAALSQKKIVILELRWSEECDNNYGHDDEILEQLQPNTNLEQLKISCYGGKKFPKWIVHPSFEMLITITIFSCDKAEALPSLGQLPSLKFLCLMEMNNVQEIGSQFQGSDEISSIAFPQLERLEIIGFPQLKRWEVANGDYPSLNDLVIEQCPKLAQVPSSLVQLPNLKRLEILHCSALTSLLATNLSTSLVTLIIDECPLITKEFEKWKAGHWRDTINHVQSVWINQEEIITDGN